jgi:transmembrane sensor
LAMAALLSKKDRLRAESLFAGTFCGEAGRASQAKKELDSWAAESEERSAYLRELRAADCLIDAAAPALRERYPRALVKAPRVWPRLLVQAAACALLLAVIATVAWLDPPLSRVQLATGIGERRGVALRDGSQVTLNTASRVEIVMRLRSREAVLEAGEALFEIVPGSTRPFRVIAGDARVEVIGTMFNVRRTGHGARVAVLEGKVALRAGTEEALLGRGEAAETAADKLVSRPHPVNLDATVSWREGRLVFDNVPLSLVLAEAQRYRRAPIVIGDAAAARWRITAAFPTNDPDRLLKLLSEALPIDVRLLPDGTARVTSRAARPKPRPGEKVRAPVLLPIPEHLRD